jgi:hypothetical protein
MPSTPQVVATTVIFDYLVDVLGKPLVNAEVKVTLDHNRATAISPVVSLPGTPITTTTDANGYWQVSLVPNSNINPANTTYTARAGGQSFQFSIPGGVGPYQVSTILVSTPVALMPAGPYTAGGLFFGGTAGAVTQDTPQLFWDDINRRLGIGISTPAATLDVNGPASGYALEVRSANLKVLLLDVETGATTGRLMPPTAVAHINSDAAILTLLRAPFVDGTENNTFVDLKLSFDGTSHGVIHLLGDRSGTDVAPNIFTVELDPRNQSTDAEFQVVRSAFRGGGGAVSMFDIVQGVGITAIENNQIRLAGGNFVLQTTAGDIVTQPSGNFRPFSDGLHDLGQQTFRYATLWTQGVKINGDQGGTVNFATLTSVGGVGNGALGNVQAPARGTGTGPATPGTVSSFIKAYSGTTVVWIPVMV